LLLLPADENACRLKNRRVLFYGEGVRRDMVTFRCLKKREVVKPDMTPRYFYNQGNNSQQQQQQPQQAEKDFYHLAVMPAGEFFKKFQDPVAFADHLEMRCKEQLVAWEAKNASVMNRKARKEEDRAWPLLTQTFTMAGKQYTTVYEMQTSLHQYTINARAVDEPEPPLLRDIAASSPQIYFTERQNN